MVKKKQSIVENGIAMFIGTSLNVLISVITTPIITRLVLPADYGQWSLLSTYSNIILAIVMVGMDQAFVRFYYKHESVSYKRYLTFTAVKIPVALLAFAIIVLSCFISKLNLFEENSTIVYVLLYLNVLLAIVNKIAQLVLRMEQRGREYSLLMVVNKIVYLIIVFTLIFFSSLNDFVILTIGTVGAQLVVTISAIMMGRDEWRLFAPKPDCVDVTIKQLLLYGLPFVYAILAGDIFNAADKWAIKAIKTYSDVGIYSAAANIVAICAVVNTTFILLWAPLAMEHYEKAPEEKNLYIKANAGITAVMFVIGAIIICFKDVIVLLLGVKYRLAVTIVPFLLFNPIMTTISETTVYGINFKGKTWYHMIITTVSALLNVALNAFLVPKFSCEGAALATAVSYTAFFVLRTALSNHVYPVKFEIGKFAIATIAFSIYSFLNTFTDVNFWENILMFVCFAIIITYLYHNYLKLMINILKYEVKNRFHGS